MSEIVVRQAPDEKHSATPTNAQYMRGGAKELLSIAETIAAGVPVPLLSEFMKVAIGVLEACEVCDIRRN
jgi:hypothetical protein